MAKKNEAAVELRPTAEHMEDFTDLDVLIKNRRVGHISQTAGERFVSIENYAGKTGSARSVEDGLEMILADYHLHT